MAVVNYLINRLEQCATNFTFKFQRSPLSTVYFSWCQELQGTTVFQFVRCNYLCTSVNFTGVASSLLTAGVFSQPLVPMSLTGISGVVYFLFSRYHWHGYDPYGLQVQCVQNAKAIKSLQIVCENEPLDKKRWMYTALLHSESLLILLTDKDGEGWTCPEAVLICVSEDIISGHSCWNPCHPLMIVH